MFIGSYFSWTKDVIPLLVLIDFIVKRSFFFFFFSFVVSCFVSERSFRIFTERGPPEGVVVHAPIIERTAFAVLSANQGLWGRRLPLWLPRPDTFGCTKQSLTRGLENVAVLVLDGGCSPEQKSMIWQQAGARAIVLATRFQWVSDLAAIMSDHSDMTNVTIPLFFVKYDSNWRTRPTNDWGTTLIDELSNERNVSVQLDFPDREEITWDLRSGSAKLSAFLNYLVMTWSVILLVLLGIKVTLILEVTKNQITVPLFVLSLDMFSCFFMLMSSVFGPYFSSGFFCSEVLFCFSELVLVFVCLMLFLQGVSVLSDILSSLVPVGQHFALLLLAGD